MKKSIKLITTLMLTLTMIMVTVESASAATYSWTATKTPGVTGAGLTYVQTPLYKGKMTFKLTALNGDCSNLASHLVSSNASYYYIKKNDSDTEGTTLQLTKVGGEQSFYMGFTTAGNQQSVMKFTCSVVHNAGINDTVSASGQIYY